MKREAKHGIDSEIPNRDLPEMMSFNLANNRENNQQMLLRILSTALLLDKITWYPCRNISVTKEPDTSFSL